MIKGFQENLTLKFQNKPNLFGKTFGGSSTEYFGRKNIPKSLSVRGKNNEFSFGDLSLGVEGGGESGREGLQTYYSWYRQVKNKIVGGEKGEALRKAAFENARS